MKLIYHEINMHELFWPQNKVEPGNHHPIAIDTYVVHLYIRMVTKLMLACIWPSISK